MRQIRGLLPLIGGLAFLAAGAASVAQAPTATDWVTHRGQARQPGYNGDTGLQNNAPLGLVWVWPRTMDMPAEMVADDRSINGATFTTAGAWTVPAVTDRMAGAWPPIDQDTDAIGSYHYAAATRSTVLANIGVDELARLPDLGTDGPAAQNYHDINNELVTNGTTYARWTFGQTYPAGTKQGTVDVAGRPLQPNQRYALYIRFPASGTTLNGGTPQPNIDHVMVRVSWGTDVNDPVRSRIFMLNFGQTGGEWIRIQSGAGDDRFFPYDGTHPLQVTLYALSPDDPTATAAGSAIVPADAVRLVPEALRGDIHAPAASRMFGTRQLTYFGRDETFAPPALFGNNTPTTGFQAMPVNPTLAASNNNPIVADVTSSMRNAVFYCVEDDTANTIYGRLVWRFVARTGALVGNVTIDNSDQTGAFATAGTWTPVPGVANVPYGADYVTAPTVATGTAPDATATWTAALPTQSTYSVYVYVPKNGAANQPLLTTRAHYQLTTDTGTFDFYMPQNEGTAGQNPVPTTEAGWRLLTTGVHFPTAQVNGQTTVTGKLVLLNDAPDGGANINVAADAVQFVPEGSSNNRVVAAPAIAHVKWPSGTYRDVVYFATTDGHVWALDALGAQQPSTLTTCYWVYPSVTNPTLANGGAFRNPGDDPNVQNDPVATGRPPDADFEGGALVRKTPTLGAFLASPVYVEYSSPADRSTYQAYIVIGNQNGRIYAFDPAGRVDQNNDPFPATFAQGDNPGIPGTTFRTLTWPSVARDKWIASDPGRVPSTTTYPQFLDDPAKGYFSATPSFDEHRAGAGLSANTGVGFSTMMVAGAGDGHVYALSLALINRAARSTSTLWQFPEASAQVDPITLPGALSDETDSFAHYVFSAGGRVWGIQAGGVGPRTDGTGHQIQNWVYPLAAAPGNPQTGNTPALQTAFTAPIWFRPTVALNLNGNNPVAFAANQNGSIYAFDATTVTGLQPGTVWGNPNATPSTATYHTTTVGSTRASATLLAALTYTQTLAPTTNPTQSTGLFLPTDTGSMVAFDAANGALMWSITDALLGHVPATATTTTGNNTTVSISTSVAWRGADAITSNTWVYQGDEGNQANGEMNGQMRGYWDTNQTGGIVTPGEPDWNNGQTGTGVTGPEAMDTRVVDLFYSDRDTQAPAADQVFQNFGPSGTTSPYKEWSQAHQVPDNGPNGAKIVIYEWGDTIRVAAWGAFLEPQNAPNGVVLPTLTFTLTGNGQSLTRTVAATADAGYTANGANNAALLIQDPAAGWNTAPAKAWVAKAEFPLGRGSAGFSQVPGSGYRITAVIQPNVVGFASPAIAALAMVRMAAGQTTVTTADPNPPMTAGTPPRYSENTLTGGRNIALAHPLAISTASYPGQPGYGQAGQPYGTSVNNLVGWVPDYFATGVNRAQAAQELLANGNRLATVDTNGDVTVTAAKSVVAPLGLVSDNTSSVYLGVDNGGTPQPALFIADRSNLYKMGQALGQIRIDRQDVRWIYNANSGGNAATTGNVMNPLPWETFPTNSPNTSLDYPDIPRNNALVRTTSGQQNLAAQAVSLNAPEVNGTTKNLRPVQIDLQVSVPRYQPANVNTDYVDINGAIHTRSGGGNGPFPMGLTGPMRLATGQPASGGQQLVPSGGYVGTLRFFIDTVGRGQFQNSAARPAAAQAQQAVVTNNEMVFRQFDLGLAVPPSIKLQTAEETIDLGKQPQSAGYAPSAPFAPSYIGPYANSATPASASPWDDPTEASKPRMFAPFTVRSSSNINLVNIRVAKSLGNGSAVAFSQLGSDTVSNFADLMGENGAVSTWPGKGFVPAGHPASTPSGDIGKLWAPRWVAGGTGAVGNLGLVSSLDHGSAYGGTPLITPGDNSLWPFSLTATPVGTANPYVQGGNVVGWPAGVNPVPTLHKPRAGDIPPTLLSVPDVMYGDPQGVLAAIRNRYVLALNSQPNPLNPLFSDDPTKPRVGVAIPVGTPAGTYYASVFVYEDGTPGQWRDWLNAYRQANGQSTSASNTDDNQVLEGVGSTGGQVITEAASNPPFRLKVTVTETKLTGPNTPTSYFQVDRPSTVGTSNIQPAGLLDRGTGNLLLWWSGNRQKPQGGGNGPEWLAPGPDSPWFLFGTQLAAANKAGSGNSGAHWLDWQYYPGQSNSRWWMSPGGPFPDVAQVDTLFPAAFSAGVPGVPGTPVANTLRFGSPAMAQNDAQAQFGQSPGPVWLFWQGSVYKQNAGAYALDTRTFYTKLNNGAPDSQFGIQSFQNDPNMPKQSPKPLVVTVGNTTLYYLFWSGGARGRTRVFYNRYTGTGDPTDPTRWSADSALPVPADLQWMADPVPVHRTVVSNGQPVDALDVFFTGVLIGRRQAETLVTRYEIRSDGRLTPISLPATYNETLVREGGTQNWVSRDVMWLFRDGNRRIVDPGTNQPTMVRIFVNRGANSTPINAGPADFDPGTGKVFFASTLGGQIVVDPQSGRITFTGVAPKSTDVVSVDYTAQCMRVNVSRNDGPFGLNAPNPPPPATAVAGSSLNPVAFLDRGPDARTGAILMPGGNGGMRLFQPGDNPIPVTRYWTLYRKTDVNASAPSSIYYTTRRLMVRLPRGVLRDLQPDGTYTIGNHVRIVGSTRPVGPIEVDWVRGRLYFTEQDEGNDVQVTFDYGQSQAQNGNPPQVQSLGPTWYRVTWQDEISTAILPNDQTTAEAQMPSDVSINEGQISAFKDPFADRVWVFWASTRSGVSDLYSVALSPQFYTQPGTP